MTDTETRPNTAATKAERYGGFYRPRGWGIWRLGPLGSAVAGVMAIASILVMLTPVGIWGSVILLAGSAVILRVASTPDRHGKTWFQRAAVKRAHDWRKSTGQNRFVPSGITGRGTHKLPGVTAMSELHIRTDSDGEEFAILRYPSRGHYVVSLRARPDGTALLDADAVGHQVDAWGDWLATLADEEDLTQAIVTIQTSPDGGPIMRRKIQARRSPHAHPMAVAWMKDVLEQYPRGSQGVSATISLTFRTPSTDVTLDGAKIPKPERLDEVELVGQRLASRVPHIIEDLGATGAGSVELMTADDLIETVRCAYDPDAAVIYSEARARGELQPVSTWDTVGPSGAVAEWGYYAHGTDWVSVTWEFTGFTSTALTARSLLPLIEANDNVEIKRVSIIYRPLPRERSSQVVETNHQAAAARLGDAKKPTARQVRAVREADQARGREADGYVVTDTAVLVTATVHKDQLATAHAAVSRLGPTARLHLRPMNGLQDVGFPQAVGVLGLVSESYLNLPPALTNGI